MVFYPKAIITTVLRLMAVALLLGCGQLGSAAGTWSVISLPSKPTEVTIPTALATDAAGNPYVADQELSVGLPESGSQIERRDT